MPLKHTPAIKSRRAWVSFSRRNAITRVLTKKSGDVRGNPACQALYSVENFIYDYEAKRVGLRTGGINVKYRTGGTVGFERKLHCAEFCYCTVAHEKILAKYP